jgi:hypothetical protein
MHVGDIDGATVSPQNTWSATVTITLHDEGHRPLADDVVSVVDFTVLGASNSTSFYCAGEQSRS